MRRSTSGTKIPTLMSSQIISASWRQRQVQIFIWLILARCGACGGCCKIRQRLVYRWIRRHLASLASRCWCRFALMSMLLNSYHRRGWTENVTITALRWVTGEIRKIHTKEEKKQYHRSCTTFIHNFFFIVFSSFDRSTLDAHLVHGIRWQLRNYSHIGSTQQMTSPSSSVE